MPSILLSPPKNLPDRNVITNPLCVPNPRFPLLKYLKAVPHIVVPLLLSRPIPNPILSINNPSRKTVSNTEEHKERPLPPERVDYNAEREPPDQFQVREEVKGSGRRELLQRARHIDPALHPEWTRARKRVREEH